MHAKLQFFTVKCTREALFKPTMSHVAVKFEMIARRIAQAVAAHGLVTGAASRLRVVCLSHLSRTCAARYRVEVATLRCQAMQQHNRTRKEYHRQSKPQSGKLLAKGMAINFHPLPNPLPEEEGAIALSPSGGKLKRGLAFLAPHPAKPGAWPCGA